MKPVARQRAAGGGYRQGAAHADWRSVVYDEGFYRQACLAFNLIIT